MLSLQQNHLKYSQPPKEKKKKTNNKPKRKKLGVSKEIPGSQLARHIRKKQHWGPSTAVTGTARAAPCHLPEETELPSGKQPVFRLQAKLGT